MEFIISGRQSKPCHHSRSPARMRVHNVDRPSSSAIMLFRRRRNSHPAGARRPKRERRWTFVASTSTAILRQLRPINGSLAAFEPCLQADRCSARYRRRRCCDVLNRPNRRSRDHCVAKNALLHGLSFRSISKVDACSAGDRFAKPTGGEYRSPSRSIALMMNNGRLLASSTRRPRYSPIIPRTNS